jgi:Archaeal PaREP1/PaREP8 family
VKFLNLNASTDNIANIEKIQQYLQNSEHYYDNSHKLIMRKELAKAGELLWGAIAEAAKALQLMVKGEPVNEHKLIRKYLRQLSVEHSREIKMAEAANQLHVNFYETDLLQQDESRFFEQYGYGESLYRLLMDKINEEMERTTRRI